MALELVSPALEKERSNEKPEGEAAEALVVVVEMLGEKGTLAQPERATSGSEAGKEIQEPGASQESTCRLEASDEVHEEGSVRKAGGSDSSKCVQPS
jgi:hypothetical protein